MITQSYLRSTWVCAAVLAVALSASAGAASAQPQEALRAGSENLPEFLAEVGAEALSVEEAEAIRGERVPNWVIRAAVNIVKNNLGQTIAVKLQAMLERTRTPTYRDYERAFGPRWALIYSLLPSALRPHIVR